MRDIPIESTKCDGCLGDIANVSKADTAAKEDGKSDEACEPKGHGHGICGEECEAVVCDCWELVQGCEAEVNCRD